MVITIKEYLDREFEGIDVSLGQTELFRMIDPLASDKFEELVGVVMGLWSTTYASPDSIMAAEGATYDFLYKNPELVRISLAVNRDREERTLEFVMDNISKPKSLLDLGCGEGLKSVYYALATSAEVTGIDIIPSGLYLAKKRAEKYRVNTLLTVEADISDFDTEGNYDVVLANCVLHESGDNRDGGWNGPSNRIRDKVERVATYLSPGGLFIATLDECHGSGGVAYSVTRHAEDLGLKNIGVETILKGDHTDLIAVKAFKSAA